MRCGLEAEVPALSLAALDGTVTHHGPYLVVQFARPWALVVIAVR